MDCATDVINKVPILFDRRNVADIWHRTSDNLISFLIRRYKYAKTLYCERTDRRWKMIDTQQDKLRLIWFVFSVITVIPCLIIRGLK